VLDLEAMEGAEYYRKLAEWLDRASRVLFPVNPFALNFPKTEIQEIIHLYCKQAKAGSCPAIFIQYKLTLERMRITQNNFQRVETNLDVDKTNESESI
jgi:hypothetical protein